MPPETLLDAVAVHWLPAVLFVLQVASTLETDQILLPLVGVTESIFHVSATPIYDVTVMLGLHDAGAMTVASGCIVLLDITALVGAKNETAAPVLWPLIESGIAVGAAPVPAEPAEPVAPVGPVAPAGPGEPLLP